MVSFDAILPILAAAFFLGGLTALVILLLQILRLARLSGREKKYRLVGWQSDLRRAALIACAIVAIAGGNLVFWVNRELRLYSPVYQGMPVATVAILRPESLKTLPRLVYSASGHEGGEAYEVFPVRDAKFRMSGERIRWSRHLSGLGLADFFKATTLEFLPKSGTPDATKPHYVVDVRQGSSALFERLRRYQKWLPFVVADTMATTPLDARVEFSASIYIDSTGLVLR
jgi:hypothetical protein